MMPRRSGVERVLAAHAALILDQYAVFECIIPFFWYAQEIQRWNACR